VRIARRIGRSAPEVCTLSPRWVPISSFRITDNLLSSAHHQSNR